MNDDHPAAGLTVPARRARGNAFGATPKDLSPFGYDECEYLISGEAVGSDDGGAPGPGAFATRFLVRRPTDPARLGPLLHGGPDEHHLSHRLPRGDRL